MEHLRSFQILSFKLQNQFDILDHRLCIFQILFWCTETNKLLSICKNPNLSKSPSRCGTTPTENTYLTSRFGLHSVLEVNEKQYDNAAIENNETPSTHSRHTIPTWTYGKMLNSKCKSIIKPGVSFSTDISNQTIGKTILSNGFTRLLNFVLSNNKLIWMREWTLIGTPNCCATKKKILKSNSNLDVRLHLRVAIQFRSHVFLHLARVHPRQQVNWDPIGRNVDRKQQLEYLR